MDEEGGEGMKGKREDGRTKEGLEEGRNGRREKKGHGKDKQNRRTEVKDARK